jgi:REP element-mobilizing transposase RayT
MSGTYTNLLYHIVFSTKERRRWITPAIEDELHKYMGGIVRNLEGDLLEANGDMDHRHLLVLLKPKFALSDVVRDIKASSSGWLNETKNKSLHKFGWQDGYAAFTVSESQTERIAGYIRNQKQRHRRMDFKSELLGFLEKNRVKFDERYLWR